MVETLRPTVAALRAVAEKLGVPLLFGETGCRSVHGGAVNPGEYRNAGRYSPEEQANFLEAMCVLFWDEPWWLGFYWWKWDEQQPRPQYATDTAGDTGFVLEGKPAADVLRTWFARPVTARPAAIGTLA